ncbi:MAG: FMN-binding protein [Spirochaetales bacterium]|nr:FMN-binding protein [Spirochaetales bacterium]
MKKSTWKIDLKSAVFLVIITTVCTLFLSGTNALYQGVIAERQKTLRMEILQDFGITFTEMDFSSSFDNNVDVIQDRKNTYFVFKGAPRQGAIDTTGQGLWGTIQLLIMINEESKQITKLKVLHHTETPGLGGRIEEDVFLNQFQGLNYSDSVKIVKEKKGEPGEVDAISGATVTSKSVETIINNAIQRYQAKTGR